MTKLLGKCKDFMWHRLFAEHELNLNQYKLVQQLNLEMHKVREESQQTSTIN